MNDSWKRKVRRNGDKTTYVVIPKAFIEALNMPWAEFWNTAFVEFKVQDGKKTMEFKV